jgi:hypothetical protein
MCALVIKVAFLEPGEHRDKRLQSLYQLFYIRFLGKDEGGCLAASVVNADPRNGMAGELSKQLHQF